MNKHLQHCIIPMILLLFFASDLSAQQVQQLTALEPLYEHWNQKVNVISRKDINSLYTHHVLHSLGIARVCQFAPGSTVLDVGTGGGFPGIPLAILFPQTQFHLVDSTGKKIMVVNEVIKALGLQNITAEQVRAEQVSGKFDFVVSRAVTRIKPFYGWVRDKIKEGSNSELANGILYLKGGDLAVEMKELGKPYQVFELNNYFQEDFFETKKVVYVKF